MRERINYAEFYMTNVCNFNCDGCNRFNNYYFSGQQKWEDYADLYKEWGELVNIRDISILGGEPTLNPTFLDWVNGIADIWRIPKIGITTNGTRLNDVKGFYETLLKYKGRVWVEVSLHNTDRKEDVIESCKEFLDEVTIKQVSAENIVLIDKNKIKIMIGLASRFDPSAVIENNGTFEVRNSNMFKAFKLCDMKRCHHFVEGKLYKCGVTALLPKFYEQFHFNISDEDKELMNAYEPLTTSHTKEEREKFVSDLTNEMIIPQCKFCPDFSDKIKLHASTDKTRIKKKKP
jgi:organic radical activating enzyme